MDEWKGIFVFSEVQFGGTVMILFWGGKWEWDVSRGAG